MDRYQEKNGQLPPMQGYSQFSHNTTGQGNPPGYGFNSTGQSYPPQPVNAQPTSQQQTSFVYTSSTHVAPSGQQTSGTPPRDWLIPAVLVTIFCAWPLGILAIMQASKSRQAVQRGDFVLAETAARSAKNFIIFAVVVGVIGWTFVIASIVIRVILQT